jgi:hypothetical protein
MKRVRFDSERDTLGITFAAFLRMISFALCSCASCSALRTFFSAMRSLSSASLAFFSSSVSGLIYPDR